MAADTLGEEIYPRSPIPCYAFGMSKHRPHFDDLTARRDALRLRLRVKADQVLEAVEALPTPTTIVEAEQAAQAVMVAERMVTQVFSEPETAKAAPILPKSLLH